MSQTVPNELRHTKQHPCPLCGGHDLDPRGQGVRCSGYTSADGLWCRCTRIESPERDDRTVPPTYRHLLRDTCRCGVRHGILPDSRPAATDERVVYTYVDETGEDHHRVTVTGHGKGKRVFQHRWDGSQWVKGRPERLILYRLPDILSSDGPVYLVEGERDVETLRKRGLVATTSAMGAGSWGQTAACAAEHLAGRDVIIVRDLDEEGLKYARGAEKTLHPVARSVRMLEPARGKDVTDHFALGGELSDLVPVGGAAPPPAKPEAPKLRIVRPQVAPPPVDPPSDAEVPWGDGEPPSGESDPRPEIIMGPDLHRVLSELERHMAALDPGLYQRGRELVTVLGADGERGVADGTPVIRPLTQAAILPRITSRVAFIALRAPTPKAVQVADAKGEQAKPTRSTIVPPTTHVVQPFLAQGEWPNIRLIRGVAETPVLRPDGTVLQTAGYDDATGYLYAPNANYLPAPENPTQEEAQEALALLRSLYKDFPYAPDRMGPGSVVAIAALLTVIARPAIRGPVPVFAFEASTQGSGKTLQCDVVHLIATGRPAPVGDWPVEEEEQRKKLNSIALAAPAIALLDNIKGILGGGTLEGMITSQRLSFRALGSKDLVDIPWLGVVMVSGNNMQTTTDMLRRTLLSRIEPEESDPTTRQGLPDLPPIVEAGRTEYVRAALTILRSYCAHGRPDAGARMASFQPWASLVANALIFAGGPNVTLARPSVDVAASDELTAAAVIVSTLPALLRSMNAPALTTKAILSAIYPAPRREDPPDGYDELREAIETMVPLRGAAPEAKTLGMRLRRHLGKWYGRSRLVPGAKTRDGVATWSIETRDAEK